MAKNKTRKHVQGKKVVTVFLEMLLMIKLYHWKTTSYAVHKATDELYGKLNENIDQFIEILLGKTGGGRLELTNQTHSRMINVFSLPSLQIEVEGFKKYLVHLPLLNDLANIRDDILGNLNQFLYLLSFK